MSAAVAVADVAAIVFVLVVVVIVVLGGRRGRIALIKVGGTGMEQDTSEW